MAYFFWLNTLKDRALDLLTLITINGIKTDDEKPVIFIWKTAPRSSTRCRMLKEFEIFLLFRLYIVNFPLRAFCLLLYRV